MADRSIFAPLIVRDSVQGSESMAAMDNAVGFNPEDFSGCQDDHILAGIADVDMGVLSAHLDPAFDALAIGFAVHAVPF